MFHLSLVHRVYVPLCLQSIVSMFHRALVHRVYVPRVFSPPCVCSIVFSPQCLSYMCLYSTMSMFHMSLVHRVYVSPCFSPPCLCSTCHQSIVSMFHVSLVPRVDVPLCQCSATIWISHRYATSPLCHPAVGYCGRRNQVPSVEICPRGPTFTWWVPNSYLKPQT